MPDNIQEILKKLQEIKYKKGLKDPKNVKDTQSRIELLSSNWEVIHRPGSRKKHLLSER